MHVFKPRSNHAITHVVRLPKVTTVEVRVLRWWAYFILRANTTPRQYAEQPLLQLARRAFENGSGLGR